MNRLYLFFLFLWASEVYAQEAISMDAIQESIFDQLALFPQEKIHLHTDRTMYVSGEKIWFKAYVVDAFSHESTTGSRYVYVELVNAADLPVHRVMVSPDEYGMYYGNLFLPERIAEGDYTLRAYTRYMENLGDGYFFIKPISIKRLKASEQQAKRQPDATGDYEVSFYPEGGYLTAGEKSRMAFKVLKRDGTSESITGEVFDQDGNGVTEVNTVFAGMGSFHIIPEESKVYYLNCKNQNGLEKRFKLPDAQKTYSLAVNSHNKQFLVEVRKSPGMADQPLYLLVHCRGEALYYSQWDDGKSFISFPFEYLPAGVIQLVLFDGHMNPLSERLIFNKTDDRAKLVFASDKPAYQKREKVFSEIFVTGSGGIPLTGHLSVAVTDDRDVAPDTLHTILSSLLLSSELKGYIEWPGYYLQESAQAKAALDLLMMTNGWRRYDISEVIKGNHVLPETEYEITKKISGTVNNSMGRRFTGKGEVSLFSSDGSVVQVETDSAGFFCFSADYPDSVTFILMATNQRRGINLALVLNQEKFPTLKHAPKSLFQPSLDAEAGNEMSVDTSGFIEKARQRAQYDDDMRLMLLPEVVVSAQRIEKRDEARLAAFPFNKNSDITVYREDFEKKNPGSILDLLHGIAGVFVGEVGNISIRGPSSILYSGNPLVLIDGIYINEPSKSNTDLPFVNNIFSTFNVHEIESIDIFKDSNSAAIFGSRGAFGAISITTRKGERSEPDAVVNHVSLAPLGYQKPVEFYSPAYESPESKYHATPDYRSTIFWKPDLILSENGIASFEFYTSDFPTTYTVIFEGLSNDGIIIRHVEKIAVK